MKKIFNKINIINFIFIVFCCVISCFAIFKNEKPAQALSLNETLASQSVESDLCEEVSDSNIIAEASASDSYYCLRDDYIIYTENQQANGLCWAFTSNTVLTSTIAKATNEYIDFSEAWISVANSKTYSDYTLGGGGHFYGFNEAIQHGTVLEQDFLYENSYTMDTNQKNSLYDHYSTYANTSIANYLTKIDFDYQSNTVQKRIIKNHVLKNGAVYLGLRWKNAYSATVNGKTVWYKEPSTYLNYTGDIGGHAITLIGWDDNISIYARNGSTYRTYTGAWICLNSWGEGWGNDGIFYIFYDDADLVVGDVEGFSYSDIGQTSIYFSTKIEGGGYEYETNLKGAYYSTFNATTSKTLQRNIYFSDDVDLTYKFTASSGTRVNYITIYNGQEEVTEKFTTTVNNSNMTYRIQANDLNIGPYKVEVTYTQGSVKRQHYNMIYVCNGSETSSIEYYDITGNMSNGYVYAYNSFNKSSLDLTIYTVSEAGDITFRFIEGTYSNYYLNDNTVIQPEIFTAMGFVTSNSINSGYWAKIHFSGLSPSNLKQVININFLGLNFNLNVCYLNVAQARVIANVHYNLYGGTNDENNLSKVAGINSATIKAPTKKGFVFKGWYYDSSLTKPLSISSVGYVIDFNKLIKLGDNPTLYNLDFYNDYYNNHNYIFIYAKWEFDKPQISITSSGTIFKQGEQITLTLNIQHELKNMLKVSSYWYKNDEIYQTDKTSITDTLTEVGTIIYTLRVSVSYRTHTFQSILDIEVIVEPLVPSINDIEIDEASKSYKWELPAELKNDSSVKYKVSLYRVKQKELTTNDNSLIVCSNTEDELIGTYTLEKDVTTFNVLDKIKSLSNSNKTNDYSGEYYLKVLVSSNNADSIIKESSVRQTILKINFNSNVGDDFGAQYIYSGEKVEEIVVGTKKGYDLTGWKIGAQNFSFDQTLTANTTITANFDLKNITFNQKILGINKTYDDSESSVNVIPSPHSSGLNAFTYKWYKNNVEIKGIISNQISFKNVKDSGTYYCAVTLKDTYGNAVTTNSQKFTVQIDKASTVINTDNITTSYIYNGDKQVIDGATINHTESKIQYSNNSFTDVPEGGVLQVTIYAPQSDNYYGATTTVNVTVKKAETRIDTSAIKTSYVYNGSLQTVSGATHNRNDDSGLEYTNNTFKDVPTDGRQVITITAPESKNYLPKSKTITVYIEKADSGLKIDDVNQTFTYNGEFIKPDYKITNNEQSQIEFPQIKNAGEYKNLTLKLGETKNYKGIEAKINITVNKAQSGLKIVNKTQKITYNACAYVPEYEITNSEQTNVSYPTNLVHADTYAVRVELEESENYLGSYEYINLIIEQATIKIKTHDVTSWLFMPQQKLSYTITEGEIYNGDDLGITLSCDVNTGKIGSYSIIVDASNSNYFVIKDLGVYTVTVVPYIIIMAIVIVIIVTLFVVFRKRNFAIDFEENGGDYVPAIETKNLEEIVIPTPSRQGFKFVGWYEDKALSIQNTQQYKKGKQKVLYAKWEKEIEENIKQSPISHKDVVNQILNKNEKKQIQIVQEVNVVNTIEKQEPIIEESATQKQNIGFNLDDVLNSINKKSNITSETPQDIADIIKKASNKNS